MWSAPEISKDVIGECPISLSRTLCESASLTDLLQFGSSETILSLSLSLPPSLSRHVSLPYPFSLLFSSFSHPRHPTETYQKCPACYETKTSASPNYPESQSQRLVRLNKFMSKQHLQIILHDMHSADNVTNHTKQYQKKKKKLFLFPHAKLAFSLLSLTDVRWLKSYACLPFPNITAACVGWCEPQW